MWISINLLENTEYLLCNFLQMFYLNVLFFFKFIDIRINNFTYSWFNKFQIIAHKTNIGSCKVAEKCGFEWKKTLLNEYTPPNESPLDMELYELEHEK